MFSVECGPNALLAALSWRKIDGSRLPDWNALCARLSREASPWWLDSSLVGGPRGQFSFAGASPPVVVRIRGDQVEIETDRRSWGDFEAGCRKDSGCDPFEALESLLPRLIPDGGEALPELPFVGGAVGYLGYELGAAIEPRVPVSGEPTAFADAVLLFVDRLLAIDHATGCGYALAWGFAENEAEARRLAAQSLDEVQESWLASLPEGSQVAPSGSASGAIRERRRAMLAIEVPSTAKHSLPPLAYRRSVDAVVREIEAGNVYETNLTQRISLPFKGDALDLYQALRETSPAPFAAFLGLPEGAILSSSPERFMRLDQNREVESRPIKGTRRRGRTEHEDEALASELAQSEKDRAENMMIVDLVRNDLGRVCETGSVHVSDLMAIERYAGVFQMVSSVRGRLSEGHHAVDLLRASFPPGSMTGAPKIAAMQLIDRLEPVRRGVYSGALGYFDIRGGFDLSVVIRTLLVEDGQVHFHVGGAVVADSTAENECAESLDKARPMLAAMIEVGSLKEEAQVGSVLPQGASSSSNALMFGASSEPWRSSK